MKVFESAYEFVDFARGKLVNPFFLDLIDGIDKLRSGNECCSSKGFSRAIGAKYAQVKEWLTDEDKNILYIAANLDIIVLKHMGSEIMRF